MNNKNLVYSSASNASSGGSAQQDRPSHGSFAHSSISNNPSGSQSSMAPVHQLGPTQRSFTHASASNTSDSHDSMVHQPRFNYQSGSSHGSVIHSHLPAMSDGRASVQSSVDQHPSGGLPRCKYHCKIRTVTCKKCKAMLKTYKEISWKCLDCKNEFGGTGNTSPELVEKSIDMCDKCANPHPECI